MSEVEQHYLIVGLGNPGSEYFYTRHNAGFMVIDELAKFLNVRSFNTGYNYEYADVLFKSNKLTLLKPLTYMNNSGKAVKHFLESRAVIGNGIPLERVLIIYDDINLEFGTIRIRPSGSDGGQNGMYSVIYEIGSEEIPRLRIGIGQKNDNDNDNDDDNDNDNDNDNEGSLVDFVLSEFSEEEKKDLPVIFTSARDALISFIENGIIYTMNFYNKKVIPTT